MTPPPCCSVGGSAAGPPGIEAGHRSKNLQPHTGSGRRPEIIYIYIIDNCALFPGIF